MNDRPDGGGVGASRTQISSFVSKPDRDTAADEKAISALERRLNENELRVARLAADLARLHPHAADKPDDASSFAQTQAASPEAGHSRSQQAPLAADATAPLAQMEARLADLQARYDANERDHRAALAKAERDRLAARMAEERAQGEVVRLITERRGAEYVSLHHPDLGQWLRLFHDAARRPPRWWHWMPEAMRESRIKRRLRRRGLFNADAYLVLYPDVAAKGMDPIEHFIEHGMAEGRSNGI